MDLSGSRALVTGGTRGIGRAIAQRLAAAGSRVVISGRSARSVANALDEMNQQAARPFVGKACDVGEDAQVGALIDSCRAELGGLDVLINNAGIGIFKSVLEMTAAEWRDTIATNLDSLFFTCHRAIPLMREAGRGFIINIGSLAGKNAFPHGAAYNASKFGLIGFSEALMQEVRHDDIQVAYVMPGSVDTDFGRSGRASWKIAAEDVAEVVIQTLERHPRCLTSRIEMRPSKPPK